MPIAPADSRLIIVTGKGGVGKSTVATRIALELASAGQRTALCELAPARALARIFGSEPEPSDELELAPNLTGIRIASEQAMRDYVLLALRVRPLRDLLFRSRAFAYLAAATPGLAELVTLGKLWELTRDGRDGTSRYDRVVVDAPSSGHALALLESPRTFAAVTAGGPLGSQAAELGRLVADRERTSVVLVASPEELVVNETLELERRLAEGLGIEVAAIVANRVEPAAPAPAGHGPLGAELSPDGDAAVARDALLAAAERARLATADLERLRSGARARVDALGLASEPPEDPAAVGALAEIDGVEGTAG
ncbi:ArsA family ATPase [Thermoleophilia bacterium SCSIO 60948]|nr:ArsA family ATPase [Thermoleophilia bacterium SCSIO 60948]